MREAMPFILIFLALFAAGCIAYVAWELTSEEPGEEPGPDQD